MARVTVQQVPDYNYAQLLTSGHHAFVADEPEEAGGNGLGPSPYELLLWSLGACTAMTLLMYARRKGWDLQDVAVELTHDRVHAKDCAGCEDQEGYVEVIRRDIAVRGQIDDEQRQRLLEIAQRCPVHRTLQSQPKVFDTIVAGE